MKKYTLVLFLIGFLLVPVLSFAQVGDVDPNPSSECVSITNNLRYRDRDVNKNGEVSTLQDFLQSQGYLNSEPTGYFGLMTQKAVKDFQKSNSISPTGYVGTITKEKISNLTGVCASTPTETKIPTTVPTESRTTSGCTSTTKYSPTTGESCSGKGEVEIETDDNSVNRKVPCKLSSNLNIGSKDNSVYLLQKALLDAGYYPEGLITGYYGKLTDKAVNKFKSENENEDLNSLVKKLYPRECDDSSDDDSKDDSTFKNNSPVISGISGPQSLNIGQEGTWTVKASDSSGGNLSYSVHWGDESYSPNSTSVNRSLSTSQSATFTHSYSQAGMYTPTFTVTNTNGQSAKTSLNVNVGGVISTNRSPVLNLIAIPINIIEGKEVFFNFSATDPDNDDLSWSIDWGDNSGGADACAISNSQQKQRWTKNVSQIWNSAGTYAVEVEVSDCRGGTAETFFSVNVTGTTSAPVISGISGPQSLNVNQTGTWTVTASDRSGGNLSYSVDWGEINITCPSGATCAMSNLPAQQSATFTHSYWKAATYVPTFTVTNSSGQSAKTSLSVNVGSTTTINHNPVMGPSAILANIQAGQSVNFNFSATDADNDDLSWSTNWGDNTPVGIGACSTSGNKQAGAGWNYAIQHTWNTAGTYTVKVNVSDCRGGTADTSFSVNVGNTSTPSITVLLPNGGETYAVGNSVSIAWKKNGVSIQNANNTFLYAVDSRGYQTTIASNLADTQGSYVWNTSGITPGSYKIRLNGVFSGIVLEDYSDGYFDIK